MPEFITLTGRKKKQAVYAYAIVWDGKSRSKYQYDLKQFLGGFIKSHVVYEEFPVVGTRMTLDIVDLTSRVAYEMQGEFHLGFSEFGHKGSPANWLKQIKHDEAKRRWCELNNIQYVEIYPTDFPLTKKLFEEKFQIFL